MDSHYHEIIIWFNHLIEILVIEINFLNEIVYFSANDT